MKVSITNTATSWKNKKNIKKILASDYAQGVYKENNISTHYGKPLMSPSRVFKGISEFTFSRVNPIILENARNLGSMTMKHLQMWFNSKQKGFEGLEFNNVEEREVLELLIDFFAENNIKLLDVEKCVRNENWIAYIDAIGKQVGGQIFAIEIKVRGQNKVYNSDKYQVMTYHKMLYNIPVLFLIVDKKKRVVHSKVFRRLKRFEYSLGWWKYGEYEILNKNLGLPLVTPAIDLVDKSFDEEKIIDFNELEF